MKFIPFLAFIVFPLLLVSCHTPRATQTQNITIPEQPIKEVLFLYGVIEEDIHQLDKETYDKTLKGRYNDLQHKYFRERLNNHLFSMLNPTIVYGYSSLFEDYQAYPFEDFQQKIKEKGIQHILLISEKKRTVFNENIIREYQVYLIESASGKPIWVSYGYHSGTLSSIRGLARGIAKDLERGKNVIVSQIK